ncbi:hypothetical protein ACFFX1_19710 [Dactylosporangium sucinum]|uniref:Uncharacterized protein n=1 Tax=Dactylosporangium sucinum TaxID=1424081 RepID=A0A917X221_9ACTN|nr:hypothetical protein [Dactylosporangium sucinum]GGM55334.1 hypothetical protein GCM10007977_066260 [Dactylosporangium sucinum]
MSDIAVLQMLPETQPRERLGLDAICNESVNTRTKTTCHSALTDPSAPCESTNPYSYWC